MSLTSFIAMPDVAAKLAPLRPKLPRKIAVPLKAEPRSNHYMLVGTAFDYFLRFELQRRSPRAITKPWVAELAPDLLRFSTEAGPVVKLTGPSDKTWKQIWVSVSAVLANAKAAVAMYLNNKTPNDEDLIDLAGHAIRLAKLDAIYRAHVLDPGFEKADLEDVRDLVNLLRLVPFDELLCEAPLFLNPTFGDWSRLVGGADADLITGGLLVDFKTGKEGRIHARDLDQLLGYFFLAGRQRQSEPNFPVIKRLGLYFSRHAYLWTMEASVWTEHPEFPEIEWWFFQRATEVFGKRDR